MKLLKVSLTILIASFTSCNNEEPHPNQKLFKNRPPRKRILFYEFNNLPIFI